MVARLAAGRAQHVGSLSLPVPVAGLHPVPESHSLRDIHALQENHSLHSPDTLSALSHALRVAPQVPRSGAQRSRLGPQRRLAPQASTPLFPLRLPRPLPRGKTTPDTPRNNNHNNRSQQRHRHRQTQQNRACLFYGHSYGTGFAFCVACIASSKSSGGGKIRG